ncbi:hypothetical protein ACWD1Z_34735 [Streptomyces sp. NPDC002784]
MIVLPRLLAQLLTKVGECRGAELALDVVEHVMEPLTDGLCSVCGEYVTAARQALRLGRANDRPLRAHDAFVKEA